MEALSEPLSPVALLVIEDSDGDYDRLLREMRAMSPRIDSTRVKTPEELCDALSRRPYDVAISGHRLAGFSSADALKQVHEADPDLPFVVVFETLAEAGVADAMQAGAYDFLSKQTLGQLVPTLERALKVAANRRGRRTVEAALTESETRFGALTANLPGMVFQLRSKDGELTLLYVSEGSYRVLRRAPGQVVAQPSLLFDALDPSDAATLRAIFGETQAIPPFMNWEGPLVTESDDDRRWIEIAARPRKHASGAVLWDGIVNDITAAKQAQQALSELASHLTRAREEEREAVARELHDDVGSTLTGVKYDLAWLKKALRDTPSVAAKVQEIDQAVDSVILSSTRIQHDLRPGIIDEGLVASLEWQARMFERRMAIPCSFQTSEDEIDLDRDAAVAMFRVCQEALNNIAKHAGATRVDVRLDATDDALMLEIHDNGKGIAPADMAKRTCFGLRGMKERARSLDGEVEIRSDGDGGTTVAFSLFRNASPAKFAMRAAR